MFSFRFKDADSGAGLQGSVRGDDGMCSEVDPNDVFKAEETSDFLSIRVTMFPMSVTCFCICEKSENS